MGGFHIKCTWVLHYFVQTVTMIKWFCGDDNFIVINFVFLNNMLGLILNFECSLDLLFELFFSKNKIVQISLYVILFHSYFWRSLFARQNADHSIVLPIIHFHDLLSILIMNTSSSIFFPPSMISSIYQSCMMDNFKKYKFCYYLVG
jgi:hypothetical protein